MIYFLTTTYKNFKIRSYFWVTHYIYGKEIKLK